MAAPPTMDADATRLTGELVRRDTVEGSEARAADLLQPWLEAAGLTVRRHELAAGRVGLVAHGSAAPRLVLTGHLDTVPALETSWSFDPWSGAVVDGLVRGRGATDMKGGVAAVVAAVASLAGQAALPPDVAVVLTAGEETGCDGATAMAAHGALSPLVTAGAPPDLVVAEPTGLEIRRGHRGVVWAQVSAEGLAAHGSLPQAGRNAIGPLAAGVARLPVVDAGLHHPVFGPVTWNVGTFHGGRRHNVVADHAEVGLDVRTVPGVGAREVRARIRELFGTDVDVDVTVELPAVLTSESDPLIGRATDLVGAGPRDLTSAVATFFTDASVLAGALGGSSVLVLGPGIPDRAHAIDEIASAQQIEQAVEVYVALTRDGGPAGTTRPR